MADTMAFRFLQASPCPLPACSHPENILQDLDIERALGVGDLELLQVRQVSECLLQRGAAAVRGRPPPARRLQLVVLDPGILQQRIPAPRARRSSAGRRGMSGIVLVDLGEVEGDGLDPFSEPLVTCNRVQGRDIVPPYARGEVRRKQVIVADFREYAAGEAKAPHGRCITPRRSAEAARPGGNPCCSQRQQEPAN